MNTTEILQGLYLEAAHENGKVYVAAHNAAIDSAIAALEKAMLEKAGEK